MMWAPRHVTAAAPLLLAVLLLVLPFGNATMPAETGIPGMMDSNMTANATANATNATAEGREAFLECYVDGEQICNGRRKLVADAIEMRPERPDAMTTNMTMDANATMALAENATNTTAANVTVEEGRDLGICEQEPYGCP